MAKQSALLRFQDHLQAASQLAPSKEPAFSPLPTPGLHSLLPEGLPRGIIAEVNGHRSSGRISACLHILAQATYRGEVCAVVDLYDSFHPASAQLAGVRLERLVWVRCRGNAEHAMRTADLLLHAGGFGIVLLDLCDAPARILNRIPISYWHRFRLAVEHIPAILLLCAESTQAKSCASVQLKFQSKASHWTGRLSFLLLRGLDIRAFSNQTRNPSKPSTPLGPQELSMETVA